MKANLKRKSGPAKKNISLAKTMPSKTRIISVADRQSPSFFTSIGFRAKNIPSAEQRWKQLKGAEVELKALVGGKAYGLLRMQNLDMPVPPALNLSTALCELYLKQHRFSSTLLQNLRSGVEAMAKSLGQNFGSKQKPLLVSVRSGARVSMPGMMDTILNLGLNREIVEAQTEGSADDGRDQKVTRGAPSLGDKNARFWWDSYRRLIQMFSTVVLNVSHDLFEDAIQTVKKANGVKDDTELSAEAIRQIVDLFEKHLVASGKSFPQDPWKQLELAVEAVFRSWNTERAMHYRKLNAIPDAWGTSVTIQAMVFGNRNDQSATGVVFTRNPSTGQKEIYGEFLLNAQGEDVVAGIRTPRPIRELKQALPKACDVLVKTLKRLEMEFREVQDIEFTIESGRLFILQTRTAKRTAPAALEHWRQMQKEGLLRKEEIVEKISVEQVKQLLHPTLKPTEAKPIAQGLPASPGAVSGRVVFDPETAVEFARASQRVILVRRETSPEDIMGMAVAEGILTATGGMTSHAAVVARGMGKTCVVGCSEIEVHESDRLMTAGGLIIREGDSITLDGSSGSVYSGELPTEAVAWSETAREIFKWVDERATLPVLANADTPDQALAARQLGAQGIGLCRTEHMFFDRERIHQFRLMILNEDAAEREKILKSLRVFQEKDFRGIFEAMNNLSVCVRLLDPPLHEFLPKVDQGPELTLLARDLHWPLDRLKARLNALHEANPMLGHRGCRLAVTFPEIYAMQTEALALALKGHAEAGGKLTLKIMIPLIGFAKELSLISSALKLTFNRQWTGESSKFLKSKSIVVKWGTMIELPRACVVADQIAAQVDFFSFGTNDLTQTTLGLSRDDSSRFLPAYIEKGILSGDPFESLDQEGVGALVAMAVEKGRAVNPNLDLGICGEHGGDPKSIAFFHALGLNSVSCSPFRVPVARLAVAQASMKVKMKGKKK